MYRALFDLKRLPFDKDLDSESFLLTDSGKVILDAILAEAVRGGNVVLVSGGPGVGKSLLATEAAEWAGDSWRVINLDASEGMAGWEEVIQSAIDDELMAGGARADAPLLLLVDNAEQLADEELSRLLASLGNDADGAEMVRVVLFARPSLSMRLHRDSLAGARERIDLQLPLKGLSVAETADYITHRMHVAGRQGASPFTEDAVKAIHSLTQGTPRLINQRCATALNRAFRKQSRIVDASLISGALFKAGATGVPSAQEIEDESAQEITPKRADESGTSQGVSDAAARVARSAQLIGKRETAPVSASSVDEERLLEIQELLLASFKAGEALADRLESCTKRAESVATSEKAAADRLSGGQTQASEMADKLSAMMQSADQLLATLAGQVRETDAREHGSVERLVQIERREAQIDEKLALLEHRMEDMTSKHAAAERRGATAGADFDDVVLRAENVIDQLKVRSEKAAQWERDVDARLSALSETIAKKSAATVTEMETACETAVRNALSEIDRQREGARKSIESDVKALRQSDQNRNERIATDRVEIERLLKELAERETSVKRLFEDAEVSAASISEMSKEVTSRQDQVNKLLSRLDERFDAVGAQFEEMENRSESIAAIVGELNRREQDLARLLGEIDAREAAWKTMSAEYHAGRATMESMARDIDDRMGSLAERLLAVEVGKSDLSAVVDRVESSISSADGVFDRMREWDDRLKKSVGAAVERGRVVEELLAMAEMKEPQWASQVHSSTSAANLLADGCKEAHHLIEELTKAGEGTQAKIAQMESAAKSAGEMESRLEAAGGNSHELLGRLNQAGERLGALCGQLEQTLEEAMSVHGSSQQILRRLGERIDKAEEAGGKLIDQIDALEVGVVKARAATESLEEKRRDDAAALGRYEELSSILGQQAGDAAKVLGQMERMHGDILDAIKRADEEASSMRSMSESAAKLLEQFGRRQDALMPTNELLSQMFKRVRDMAGVVDQLDEKTVASRQRMEKMLELPEQIIREAKTQAAQLNDVCRSVRKVFGSLSRVSLEANERIDQYNKSRKEADDRAAKLHEELRLAGETMKEWVREAERVQGRLENTIERAPKLDRTHPSQSFAKLLDLAVGRPGDAAEAAPSQPVRKAAPVEEHTVLTNVADGRVSKRQADEIAAMIREAEERTGAGAF